MNPEYDYLLWDGSMRVRLDAEPHRQLISLHWNMGEPLAHVPSISAIADTATLPDHLVVGRINYVSERLKLMLQEFAVSAQFFKVENLRTKKGKSLTEPILFAMNVLDRTPCVDTQRSILEFDSAELGGGISGVKRLHLLVKNLSRRPLVVPDELGGAFLLMRRDVMAYLRAKSARGCRWREIEEFRLPQTTWPEDS